MRASVAIGFVLAGAVVGGVGGGLLSAYWWDFPPGDVENYGDFIVPFYATLSAIIGLIAAGILLAAAAPVFKRRRRPSK